MSNANDTTKDLLHDLAISVMEDYLNDEELPVTVKVDMIEMVKESMD